LRNAGAEQGLNVARIAVLLAGLPNSVAGLRSNRFCASGLTAVQMAGGTAPRRRSRRDDCRRHRVDEHGADDGQQTVFNARVFERDENVGIATHGLTAEKVATQWKVAREMQDEFAARFRTRKRSRAQKPASSAMRPRQSTCSRSFANLRRTELDVKPRKIETRRSPRADSTLEALAKCGPYSRARAA